MSTATELAERIGWDLRRKDDDVHEEEAAS